MPAPGRHGWQGLDQLEARGKRVLVRVDFNVPLAKDGTVRDDTRLRATLPTLRELLDKGAALVLMTHLGRPGGKPDPGLSTRPLAAHLARLLGTEVDWIDACVGPAVEARARQLGPGQVLLLENLRFQPEEEANDPRFSAALARLADLYVNDAFASSHRAHASTEGVARLLPARAGRLMEAELEQLSELLERPRRPLLAIIGGSKLSTKLGLVSHLLEVVNSLCLGGAMASTFLKAQGREVGSSLVEDDFTAQAGQLLLQARERGVALELPLDVVVAPSPEAGEGEVDTRPVEEVPERAMILDVGPETVRHWSELARAAGTVVWNGPLGMYERPLFARGTLELARAVAASPARTVIGGGDLEAALSGQGLEGQFSHVSTGGGATLEFLEGRRLPGVVALERGPDA